MYTKFLLTMFYSSASQTSKFQGLSPLNSDCVQMTTPLNEPTESLEIRHFPRKQTGENS